MISLRGIAFLGMLAPVLAACASSTIRMPVNASVGSTRRALPPPPVRSSDAPPQIVAMHFNALDLRRPALWSGAFVTSTNVASLEVRSNLFSIDTVRKNYGRFAFAVDVYDLPSIFLRSYRVRVIARNSAGTQTEEDVPLTIR
jgi:hypothetical protein